MASLQCPKCGGQKIRDQRSIPNAIIYGTGMMILGLWSLSRPGGEILGIMGIGLGLVAMWVFFSPLNHVVRCRTCGFRWDLRHPPEVAPVTVRKKTGKGNGKK